MGKGDVGSGGRGGGIGGEGAAGAAGQGAEQRRRGRGGRQSFRKRLIHSPTRALSLGASNEAMAESGSGVRS